MVPSRVSSSSFGWTVFGDQRTRHSSPDRRSVEWEAQGPMRGICQRSVSFAVAVSPDSFSSLGVTLTVAPSSPRRFARRTAAAAFGSSVRRAAAASSPALQPRAKACAVFSGHSAPASSR
jgi:hypothetical protein